LQKKIFKAFIVERTHNNEFAGTVKDSTIDKLKDGEILIRVNYSSLNYKDALSAKGNKGVTKKYPHIPGIQYQRILQS